MAGSQEPPASIPPRAWLAQVLDRVNLNRLMARLHTRTPDADVLRLIYRFLKAGVVVDGQTSATPAGVTVRAAGTPASRRTGRGIGRRPRPGLGVTLALLREPGRTAPCCPVSILFIEPPAT